LYEETVDRVDKILEAFILYGQPAPALGSLLLHEPFLAAVLDRRTAPA
jgi:hypothetical protein